MPPRRVRPFIPKTGQDPKQKEHNPLDEWRSAWFITINTQRSDKSLIEPLKNAWQYITSHMIYFVYSEIKDAEILQVRDRPTIEIGEERKRVHLHTQLSIDGLGLINLDYAKIRQYINRALIKFTKNTDRPFVKVYFNAKLVRNYNATRLIEKYLAKAPVVQF